MCCAASQQRSLHFVVSLCGFLEIIRAQGAVVFFLFVHLIFWDKAKMPWAENSAIKELSVYILLPAAAQGNKIHVKFSNKQIT